MLRSDGLGNGLSAGFAESGFADPASRVLRWPGGLNIRDLGPRTLPDGSRLPARAIVRSGTLAELTGAGWTTLSDAAIRTVIDLRNEDEVAEDSQAAPLEVKRLHLPLDAIDDRQFWDRWTRDFEFGTPRYYGPHLRRHPERGARVIRAIADASPGGVLFHCGLGRDRTGLVAILVLALLGAPAEEICEDYLLSRDSLKATWEARGLADQDEVIERKLDAERTSLGELVFDFVSWLDVATVLAPGGLTAEDVIRLRARLLR